MASPAVSVVVPAFNAEGTLAETVESALSGTYRNFELIIVDDGSTDRTARIARELAAKDSRVRLVQRENGGLPAALNSGFAVAAGIYLARLDADDLWHPEKLERQMALALATPDAAFVYTGFRYIDVQGRVLHDGPTQDFPRRALARGVYETLLGTGSSVLMRRSAVEEVGRLEESPRTWEDLLLQLKISARYPVALLPDFLVGCRIRPDSLSHGQQAMLSGWRQLRARIRELFPQVPERVHHWGHAARVLHMAESFALSRRYPTAAALLLSAFRSDPAFVSRLLAYRTGRFVRTRLSGPDRGGPGRHFFDYDPGVASGLQPYGLPAEGGAVLRLRRRREQWLEQVDRRIACLRADPPPAGERGTSRLARSRP